MKTDTRHSRPEADVKQTGISEEEQRWRRAVESPEKLARNRRRLHLLLGFWGIWMAGWLVLILCRITSFRWMDAAIWTAGLVNIGLGIVNNRRISAGKRPL